MAKKPKLLLTGVNRNREVKTITAKDLKLKANGQLKKVDFSPFKPRPKRALSFHVTVFGNTYPFTFTREQLNEAYGNAMKSVLSGETKESAIEIVK